MKLHRLDLEGFGPFRDAQRVDFDAFDDDGIFLIAGRTGSGKSSILDGVCFALFGSVPRYEASEKRVRSDHSTPEDATRVALEFTTGGSRWRVTRSPDYERPKARGGGLTTVPHAAQLDELVDGEWRTRAAKPREVAHLLDEIVGLNQQQFLQVILLAQGRFAQFLLAKNDERQSVLRTLFGTRVYQDYQIAFEERRKVAARALDRGDDGVRMLLAEARLLIDEHGVGGESDPGSPGAQESIGDPGPVGIEDTTAAQAAVERAVERAAYRADTLGREADAAEDAHAIAATELAALTALRARQGERARSRAALHDLERADVLVAADRIELARATAAEALRATIETAGRARGDAERSIHAEEAARAVWSMGEAAAGPAGRAAASDPETSGSDIAALRALIDDLTGDLTLWQAAADQEPALREALETAARSRIDVTEAESALAQLAVQRAAMPGQRAAIEAEAAGLDGAEITLESARADERTLEQRLAAAQDAAGRAAELRDAEKAHAAALAALEKAIAEVTSLLRRRLSGFAGELAESLVDGEPCAVCGALEHPQPARHDDEPVTAEMIADAEKRKDESAARESTASAAARAARTLHADADVKAGGASIDDLEAALIAATAATLRARAAVARRAELIEFRDALAELQSAVQEEFEALSAHLATAREGVAVADERVATLQALIDAARGEHASVVARIEAVTRRRRLARELADALEVRLVRDAAAQAAQDDLNARVAASDFSHPDEATASLRDAAAREALTSTIRRHDVSLATERDRLRDLELELAGAPEQLIDVEIVGASVAAARAAWRDAAAAAARAAEAATRLDQLARRIAAAHAETTTLSAAYNLVSGLADAIAGRTASRMDLETFVLAAELEEIVSAANLRLDEMSSGRYRLQHSDAVAVRNGASGLGLEVLDAYTGRTRPPQSLSGGETFLASLALALGLAEVVTARAGGIRLDTLFVDEGFGSLDAETLDLAMRTLDELRQGGRTVGVISHVEAMKEQLPAQLRVEATPSGPSVIRQGMLAPVEAVGTPA